MLRRARPIAFVLACAALAWGQGLPPAGRQANIDSFEKAWRLVRDRYWDPNLGGLDWQAVHDELRPRIEAASTMAEARGVIADMAARMNRSHFGVISGELYSDLGAAESGVTRDADAGIEVRAIDGRAVVISVDPGSPAAAKGVTPGWEIERINDVEISPRLRNIRDGLGNSTLLEIRLERAIELRLEGREGTSAQVVFRDGADRAVTLAIERVRPRGRLSRLGNMPPIYFWSEWRKVRPDVGYVRFNAFFEPETLTRTFEDAVAGCAGCKGFVIDLRGNPGGIAGLSMGVAGWFVDRPGLRLGTTHMRGATINFVIFPRPRPFVGPLAILVDGCSASTAEIFTGGLQDIKRARVFGTRTAGAALPSVIERLPNGDGFQYAIADYISEGGKPLEGNGVIPDEQVRPTRRDLLDGRDTALEAALAWIAGRKE